MKRTLFFILFTVLSLNQISCLASNELDKVLPKYLVEAEVISLKQEHYLSVEHSLRITYVYKGPVALAGKEFRVISRKKKPEGSWVEMKIYPSLKKGEVGIWFLKEGKDGLEVDHFSKIIPFHARKGVTEKYNIIEKVAKVIEEFEKTLEKDRILFLQGLVINKIPEISELGIKLLLIIDNKNGGSFLKKQIAASKLNLYGEVITDDILCRKDKSWIKSKEQKLLYKKWVTKKNYNDSFANRAINRISNSFRQKVIDSTLFLELLKHAIENPNLSISNRNLCIQYIGSCSGNLNNEEQKDYFNYLVTVIKENRQIEIRRASAYAIRNFIAFDTNRIKAFNNLVESINNEEIESIIVKAIDNNKQEKELKETIKKITSEYKKKEGKQRFEFLKEKVNSNIPEISKWAIIALGDIINKDISGFLKKKLNENIGIFKEMIIEEVLCKKDTAWVKSKDRIILYQKWVSQNNGGKEIRRLLSAYNQGVLKYNQLVKLMKLGVENKETPIIYRKNYISLIGYGPRQYRIADNKKDSNQFDLGFNYLINLVKKSEVKEIQVEAMLTILNKFTLSHDRINILKKLAQSINDDKIKKLISEAIKDK